MNIEYDIFKHLEITSLDPHDDYVDSITYSEQKQIWNRLKEKDKEIERLNNKIKEQSLLLIEFQDMEQRLKEKDNIIDTIVEMFESNEHFEDGCYCYEIEKYLKEVKERSKKVMIILLLRCIDQHMI